MERLLELGETFALTSASPGGADVVQRMGLQLAEVELSREGEALLAGLDRLVVPVRKHQEPRVLESRRASSWPTAGR